MSFPFFHILRPIHIDLTLLVVEHLFALQLHGKRKCAPLPLFAFHMDVAVHQLHELFCDGEPQSCSAETSRDRGIYLAETLEQAILLFLGNTDAAVPHHKEQLNLVIDSPRHSNYQIDIAHHGKLDGVGQKIIQDLDKTEFVANQLPWNLLVDIHAHVKFLFIYHRAVGCDHLIHHFLKVKGLFVYHEFAGFQLGKVKDIIDDRQHVVAAAEDDVERLFLGGIFHLLHQLHHMPLNAVDGCAQLMGDVRRELISRPVVLALLLLQLPDPHIHIFLRGNILRKKQIGIHPILGKNTDIDRETGVVAPVHRHLLDALHARLYKSDKTVRRIGKILPEYLGHRTSCQFIPVIFQSGRRRLIAVKYASLLIEEQDKLHRLIRNPGI